jgi:hypothetical protein
MDIDNLIVVPEVESAPSIFNMVSVPRAVFVEPTIESTVEPTSQVVVKSDKKVSKKVPVKSNKKISNKKEVV